MLKLPRVAIIQPVDSQIDEIHELFTKHEYSSRIVSNTNQIQALTLEENAPFDCIFVPLQLPEGGSGIAMCLQLKAHPMLSSVPIIALSSSLDRAVLKSLYEAGADVVCPSPYDPDQIYLQIGALSRLKRAFDEKLNKGFQETGLIHPVIKAFDSVREGLLIFDMKARVLFANNSAKILLGIQNENRDLELISGQFSFFLKEHDNSTRLEEQVLGTPYLYSSFEASLLRVNKQAFNAMLSITTLLREENKPIGYSVALTDLGEVHHLCNTLMQSQKTRTLCLMTMAACIRFLESVHTNVIVSPLRYIEEFLSHSPHYCSIDASLSCLLESLDLVVNPRVTIKVRVEKDLVLAIRRADFFQLIGHMVLHAVEHAGIRGEVSISTTGHVPGQGVTVTMVSESRKVTPFLSQDYMANLIENDFSYMSSLENISEKFTSGLDTAQVVAEKYRTTIEYQRTADAIIKLRVRLPAARPGQENS